MSPEVWDDCAARVAATAATLNLAVAWPNETPPDRETPLRMWLDIETQADANAPLELGAPAAVWEETGTIWLHVMVPVGAGIRAGLVARKALVLAFRTATSLPAGLTYVRPQSFDPMGPATDDGVYRDLTGLVRYSYQEGAVP